MYEAPHMVVIEKYLRDADDAPVENDWTALIEIKEFLNQTKRERNEEFYKQLNEDLPVEERSQVTDEYLDYISTEEVATLRPEVVDWLNENVKPSTDKARKDRPEAWAMGNDEYRESESFSLTLWFVRRNDAMKFIKHWSGHEKPTTYLNYFKDDRRKLVDGKLVKDLD